ncbi:MAG: hypothetical protein HFE30_05575 [Clostridiales bacterium]|nr:hypothetical protein [Clostridiales bacterium]
MAEAKDFEVFSNVEGTFLMYKGLPLVREDNIICYGSLDDEYILQMTIMSTKKDGDSEVPDKILLQLLKTDKSLPDHERIVKQDMKVGFYDAFEIGLIWLERYSTAKK